MKGREHKDKEEGDIFLEAGDRFIFVCHQELPCFTRCCQDVNIFLTPYDILRMKKRLELSSKEFLRAYTIPLVTERSGFPVVVLKMREDRDKRCPFVSKEGCLIYEDRPWSCRMYPLDRTDCGDRFRVIADKNRCLGFMAQRGWRVREWISDQGVPIYNEMEVPFREIVSNLGLSEEKLLNPKIRDMIYMALYDLDRFRRFVFESRLLELFSLEEEDIEAIKKDELELMNFAFKWLRFGLISGDTLKIKEEVLKARKQEIGGK